MKLEDVWSCFVCLKRATLADADGNIASATQLYYKTVLTIFRTRQITRSWYYRQTAERFHQNSQLFKQYLVNNMATLARERQSNQSIH